MKKDTALSDHVLDLLAPLGGVTRRYMFGGWGFYKEGLFFALIAEGRLYLKTGPCNAQDFIDAGLAQWVYPTDKGPMKIKEQYRIPGDVCSPANGPKCNVPANGCYFAVTFSTPCMRRQWPGKVQRRT